MRHALSLFDCVDVVVVNGMESGFSYHDISH